TETVRSGGPRREHGHPAPLSPAPGPGPLLTTRIASEGSGTASMTELILNDIENTWCPNGYCRARFDPCLCRVELVLDDERGESHERRFDLVTALRRREDEFGTVRLRELGHVPFLELGARGQVRLVHDDEDRDLPDDLFDAVDPVIEVVQGPAAREVGHREDAVRAVEVRVVEEFAEPFLTHDVPDHQVHLNALGQVRHRDVDLLLRHPRPDRGDVLLVEHVHDKPPDQGGLADGLLADEANLRLETFHRQAMSPLRGASALRRRLLNASRLVLAAGRQLATERPSRLRTIVPSRWKRSSTFSPVFAEV